MMMLFFLDSNVLIYSRDRRCAEKRETARQWLAKLASDEIAKVNLQVLNEVCHVVLRKFPEIGIEGLRKWIVELRDFGDSSITDETIEQAWLVRERFAYSWFDCLNVSSALHLGCTHFLSEDLGHDVVVFGMRIVNPFRTDPAAVLAAN
jgi:predicted nucleic acid-binding protein